MLIVIAARVTRRIVQYGNQRDVASMDDVVVFGLLPDGTYGAKVTVIRGPLVSGKLAVDRAVSSFLASFGPSGRSTSETLLMLRYSKFVLASQRALAVSAVAALAACAGGPVAHPAAPASAALNDYSYVVGAGDNLNIVVWRNPELSMSVPVRPDGKISAPLVDELVVQGKTSVQIAREVEAVLGKYVRDPIVTVMVTNFVGPYSEQIRVVGEAAKPQFLPYKQKMTLLDVMIAVGGLTDFADGNGASILRTSDAGKQYSVRLKDLIKRGDVSANVEMRPGDILIIPQSFF